MSSTAPSFPSLTLRAVTTRAVRVPLTFALGTSAAVVTAAPLLLVDALMEEGNERPNFSQRRRPRTHTARTGALAWNWKERSCGSWLDCDYHPDKRTSMSQKVDYYFSMHSPWAYIGHVPFMEVVRRHDVKVSYKPISLSDVFAKTGGLPVDKRHPARLRYRILELQRWREKRGFKFNLTP